MRASLLALLLLGACGGSETEGGLTDDEAERLNRAGDLLDQPDARFEDREVDVGLPDDGPAVEEIGTVEDEAAED